MQRTWRRMWEKSNTKGKNKLLVTLLAAGVIMAATAVSYANPTNGTVYSGKATIQGQGSNLVTINQSTNNVGINWDTFNVGTGEKVQFLQPTSSSIEVNRIIGSNASSIYGRLSSNGAIPLVGNSVSLGQGTVTIAKGATVSGNSATVYYNPVSYTDATTRSDKLGNPYKSKIAAGTLTAYMLVNNATELSNISSNLRGNYALIN